MSRYEIDEDGRVTYSLARIKPLPFNPHISHATDVLERALRTPSETQVDDAEQEPELPAEKRLRRQLLAGDQLSFITGSAAADLEGAHVLNTVRSDPLRKAQEKLLTFLRLHDAPTQKGFELDSPANAVLMEASLHSQWDRYGSFVIVPTEEDGKAMHKALLTINSDWILDLDERPLLISAEPFADPQWEILLLHPQALLPNKQPIAIVQNRRFFVHGEAPPAEMQWSFYVADGDHLRSHSSYLPLPPFHFEHVRKRTRPKFPRFSALTMIINSHFKLSRYMQFHSALATDRVKRYSELMNKLSEQILFIPRNHPTLIELALPDNEYHPEVESQAQEPGPQPTRSHTLRPRQQQPPTPEQQQSPSDVAMQPEIVEAPEIPNPDDNLTKSEFKSVMKMAIDPSLDPKEHLQACGILLFGAHPLEDPYADRRVFGAMGQES